jgi:hypothetical protein
VLAVIVAILLNFRQKEGGGGGESSRDLSDKCKSVLVALLQAAGTGAGFSPAVVVSSGGKG